MARDIKFRAWLQGKHDNINFGFDGFMDHEVTIQNGQWCSVESGWDIQGQYKSIPLMQYAGLTDKNGKEIYEGDIAQCLLKNKYQVIFNEEWAAFMLNRMGENMVIYPNMDVEIIGNIYENPDLLEGKQ